MKTRGRITDIYPLTPMQEGMLYHALADDSSYAYFEQISYLLSGELDISLVEKSLNELFKRHDILRTAFVYKEIDRPLQVVLKERVIDFYYEDISKIGEREEKENVIKQFKENDKKQSFDLSKDVLMRVSIFRAAESEYEFIWSFHHILMDGWCIGILNTEFFEIYTSYLENRPYRLPVVKPYRTYIRWLEKQDKEKSARYWENYLDSYEEQAGVPRTKILTKQENQTGYRNETVSFILDMEKTAGLNRLAGGNHVTLNIVIQTLWGVLLGKYNGKKDVVFGAVVSGRPYGLEGVDSIVGLFINTIPVRIRFEEKTKFYRLLRQIQEEAAGSEPHHYYPLAEIQSGSPLKQNLIDHLLVFENYPIAGQIEAYGREKGNNKRELKLTNVDVFEQTNYDFNLLLGSSDRLTIKFQYNGNIYEPDDIERITRHLLLAFDQVIENEELKIAELTLLSGEEKKRILYDFNHTAAAYPADKTIHRLFEEQAERTPDQAALVGKKLQNTIHKSKTYNKREIISITYKELNRNANGLAWTLKEEGFKPKTIGGILIERSVEMIIGILGILKAGGAYLPIDPGYPQERMQYMLSDSGACLLVTTPTAAEENEKLARWKGMKIFLENPALSVDSHLSYLSRHSYLSNNLAYVIYTSGSTGKPKGVMIEHRSLVNRLNWMQKSYPLGRGDVILQKTPIVFDVSLWELFWWSFPGAALCLLGPGEEKNPIAIIEAVNRNNVTTLHFVPAMLNVFLEYLEHSPSIDLQALSSLKQVFASGEALLSHHVKRFNHLLNKSNGTRLINLYGPTEAAVDVSYYNCPADESRETIPIGKPIDNIKLYIVDSDFNLQPLEVAGELCIAGVGLARGYLNRPALTREKFQITNKTRYYSSHTSYRPYILYKTGDLSRWLSDGNIEFLGRLDHQVKIRGFRIELGEIENQLLKHHEIKEAAVLAKTEKTGDQFLCAYIVTANPVDAAELRKFLGENLPGYMVPAYFTVIEKIPLTPNSKVDKKALQLIDTRTSTSKSYQPPQDEIQEKLAKIWAGVLGTKSPIGIHDSFLELGGHSLNAITILTKIHKTFNTRISLADILRTPTVKGLAEYIKKAGQEKFMSPGSAEKREYYALPAGEKKEYYPSSPSQLRMYIVQQMDVNNIAYNMPIVFKLEGEMQREKLETAFKKLIRRHASFRTSFQQVGSSVVQKMNSDITFGIEDCNPGSPGTSIDEEFIESFFRPFDLHKAPLMRVGIAKTANRQHILMTDIHHIISDGSSLAVMAKEFMALYEGEQPGELRIQYNDYSEWLNNERQKKSLKRQQEFWLKELSGGIPITNLPNDFPRPAILNFKGQHFTFFIEEDAGRLKALALKENVTLFMLLLSVFYIMLAKICGQEDIVVGITAANRNHADLQPIIGFLANNLVSRNFPKIEKTFPEFLTEVRTRTLEALDNSDYPFAELVERLAIKKDRSRNPIFDVMFDFGDSGIPYLNLPGSNLEGYSYQVTTAKLDLSLMGEQAADRFTFNINYNTTLFKEKTIEKMSIYYKNIVSSILENPGKKLSQLEIDPGNKKQEFIAQFTSDLEAG